MTVSGPTDEVTIFWDELHLRQLQKGLDKMDAALGYSATLKLTQSGVIFRYSPTWSDNPGLAWSSGSIGALTFSNAAYVIGLQDSTTLDEEERFYSAVHEFGHRTNYYVGTSIDDRMWDIFYRPWLDEHPNDPDWKRKENARLHTPSDYGERNSAEYFAEVFAFYVWLHSGSQYMPSSRKSPDPYQTTPEYSNVIKTRIFGVVEGNVELSAHDFLERNAISKIR